MTTEISLPSLCDSVHSEQHRSPLMPHLSHLKCLSCILELNAIQIENEKVTLHDVSMSVFACFRSICLHESEPASIFVFLTIMIEALSQ